MSPNEVPIYFPFDDPSNPVEMSAERKRDLADFTIEAQYALAYPGQSGYFVRTNIRAKDGTKRLSGNKEHALSDAFVHGETATISALLDLTDSPIEVLAWYEPLKDGKVVTEHDFGCPCGACLDVLIAYCATNMILLNGNETGVVYTELKDLMFDRFRQGDALRLNDREVRRALRAADGGNDVYLREDLKQKMYGAVLVAEDGTMWEGKHYTNAGYDAIPPVMNAVTHWINDYPAGRVSDKRLAITKLVIAGRGDMPIPLYRDRQAILELDEILRRFRGDELSLPVEIVQVRGKGVFVQETNVNEWLPHPFTPGALRMDDVMEAELVNLIGPRRTRKSFK